MGGYYAQKIADIVKVDLATARAVEEVMRVTHPTLDNLDAREFMYEAKVSYIVLQAMDPPTRHWYERQAAHRAPTARSVP